MYTDDPLIANSFRSSGATTVSHVAPTYENPNGSLGSEIQSLTAAMPSSGSNPVISYTDGTTYPVGDARNYLPELMSLGTANTDVNFGGFQDVGNGTPQFANPPGLPAAVAATTGGVTAASLSSLGVSGTVANEFAAAADPNPTGLLAEVNNANGLNQPLGSQTDYQVVNPVTDSGNSATTSSGPNLILIFIVLGVVGVGYYLWKSGKL